MARAGKLFVAAMAVVASGTLGAQTREVSKVGPWSIKAANNAKGQLEYCKAEMVSPGRFLRYDQFVGPRGAKNLAIPSMGLPDGSKVPAVITTAVRTVNVQMNIKPTLAWTPLSENWLAEARRGGNLTITMGKETFLFDLRDFDRAVAAVEKCVASAPVSKGAPSAAAAEVSAFMHDKGSYRRTGANWAEYDDHGKRTFQFAEISMDAQFVVIKDERRNMFVRLPLAGGQSFFAYNSAKGPWKPLYKVTARR